MSVKLRLARAGAKKKPFYRIVAADTRCPRDGRFVESLGFFNPNTEPPTTRLDHNRVDQWLSVGAIPSERVSKIIRNAKKEAEATQ